MIDRRRRDSGDELTIQVSESTIIVEAIAPLIETRSSSDDDSDSSASSLGALHYRQDDRLHTRAHQVPQRRSPVSPHRSDSHQPILCGAEQASLTATSPERLEEWDDIENASMYLSPVEMQWEQRGLQEPEEWDDVQTFVLDRTNQLADQNDASVDLPYLDAWV